MCISLRFTTRLVAVATVWAASSCGSSNSDRIAVEFEAADKTGAASKFEEYAVRTFRSPLDYLTQSPRETMSSGMSSTQFSLSVLLDGWVEVLANVDVGEGASGANSIAWESRHLFGPFERDSRPRIKLLVSTTEQRGRELEQDLGRYAGTPAETINSWMTQWSEPSKGDLTGAYMVHYGSHQLGGEQLARDLRQLESLPSSAQKEALRLAMEVSVAELPRFGWWTSEPRGAGNPPREVFASPHSLGGDILACEILPASSGGPAQLRQYVHRGGEPIPETTLDTSNDDPTLPSFARGLPAEVGQCIAPARDLMQFIVGSSASSMTEGERYAEWTLPAAELLGGQDQRWKHAPASFELLGVQAKLRVQEAWFGHDVILTLLQQDGEAVARWEWLSISPGAPYLRAISTEYSPWSPNALSRRVVNFHPFGGVAMSEVFGHWDRLFDDPTNRVTE